MLTYLRRSKQASGTLIYIKRAKEFHRQGSNTPSSHSNGHPKLWVLVGDCRSRSSSMTLTISLNHPTRSRVFRDIFAVRILEDGKTCCYSGGIARPRPLLSTSHARCRCQLPASILTSSNSLLMSNGSDVSAWMAPTTYDLFK